MNINIKKYWMIGCVILIFHHYIFANSEPEFRFNVNYTCNSMVTKYGMNNDSVVPFVDSSRVRILARAYSDSVVLRMAPIDYTAFVNATKKGIQIKRSSDNNNFEVITTVFPIPQDKLDANTLKADSFALMAAGILYGKNTSTKGMNPGDVNRANKELFGTGLMLAEFSTNAAKVLGFRFVDKNVERGKEYYYSANVIGEEEYGSTVKIKNEFIEEREPYQFQVEPGDGSLKLVWSKDYNRRQFSYYWIERSNDNKSFYPILERPLVMFETEVSENAPVFDYVDSFNVVNDQMYYYRFYGGTSFAEYSKAALASGMPKDITPPNPADLLDVSYADSTKMFTINWDFNPEELSEDLDYYQIMTSRHEDGPFIPFSPKLGLEDAGYLHELSGNWDEKNEGKHYFRIDCYDYKGNSSSTVSAIAIVPDFTSPLTPENFEGFIDSFGIVRLQWNKSKSQDVSGYWLYWTNDPSAEFSLVEQEMITDTSYIYYIPEKSLSKYIYYTLRAEDYNYNRSQAHPILKVKRLDKIAPVTPTISKINNDSCRIKLILNLSPSDDIFENEVYRSSISQEDTGWVKIGTFRMNKEFIDTSAQFGVTYQYKIRAVDTVGNTSQFSPVKSANRSIDKSLAIISDLKIKQINKTKNSELSWNFKWPSGFPNKPFTFLIFRSGGMEGVKYYKSVSSAELIFTDKGLNPDMVYNYAIQIQSEDGWKGPLSEVRSILIK